MTPVHFRTREEQLEEYMAAFVHQPTLERQIATAECELCTELLGMSTSAAPVRTGPAADTPQYVDYCGNGHYFHKWCARTLLQRRETIPCPDCRADPTDAARIAIAESFPMTATAGGVAVATPAAAAPAPARRRLPRIPIGGRREGPHSVNDHLVRWRFWLKSSQPTPMLFELIRKKFGDYMSTVGVATLVDVHHWRYRLMVAVHEQGHYQTPSPSGQPLMVEGSTKAVECKLYLPRAAALPFKRMIEEKIARLGTAEAFKVVFGITTAKMLHGTDLMQNLGPYYDNPDRDFPQLLPTPIMSPENFEAWPPIRALEAFPAYAIIDETPSPPPPLPPPPPQEEQGPLFGSVDDGEFRSFARAARNERREEREMLERSGLASSSSSRLPPYAPTSPSYAPVSP
jgi:hypothetical protein